jgi:hypothetical protein
MFTAKMIASTFFLLATLSSSLALPRPSSDIASPTFNLIARKISGSGSGSGLVEYDDLKETLTGVTIHSSCNATERRQLVRALEDTLEVATVARDCMSFFAPSDSLWWDGEIAEALCRCYEEGCRRPSLQALLWRRRSLHGHWGEQFHDSIHQLCTLMRLAYTQVFDHLIYGSKEGVLFRCDNIDGK